MTIRHLFGREDSYTITTDYGSDRNYRRPGLERRVGIYMPRSEASVSWNLFSGRGFGCGFQFGRNGGESDVGLNIYLGPLASVWLRLRSPWTKWARTSQEKDPKGWYNARHTGVRFFPHNGCWFRVEIEAREGTWSRDDPWYREMSLTPTLIFGRVNHETVEGDNGVTRIPLPEGVYLGTWVEKVTTRRYVRWPGRFVDLVRGPRTNRYIDLQIEGGIPVEGKGENSWDCGMNGLFGCGGSTLADAIGNAVKSVTRDRERYGGPHDLPRPMTVMEAENRERA